GKGLLKQWTEENFHSYDGHIFIMSMGIVYRIIAPLITDKYQDPAVVVVDDASRYAIAALSGHEGGANRLAFKAAQILDAQPVVTTASDTNKRIIIGIGCRKGTSSKDIQLAVLTVLKANHLELDEVRLAASVDIKKEEKGMIEAFNHLDIPLLFISSEKIRTFTGYKNISEAAQRQLGLPGVSEPCALLSGRNTALIQERVVTGPVTIALAREDEK
ncbi:MAG: cobalamin biosynthesis protein, partial [Spirochaetales bacterium]|nr:cobalamin biosynthesis protein [Spirochaetales bacterium]